jgi:hypothetical protein
VRIIQPLYRTQIEAARTLREKYLRQWQLSDAALLLLGKKFPDFELEACLLKSVGVNAIYGTNVLAIVLVANHVHSVLGRTDLSQAGPELVREIADGPAGKNQPSRRHTSFASKFCHFFVDAERFPIYDNAACEALKLHFDKGVEAHDYRTFCACIADLKKSVGDGCDSRMLDHYLWVTGMYKRWLREREKENPIVNAELLDLFKNPSEEQRAALDAMLPVKLERTFKGEL